MKTSMINLFIPLAALMVACSSSRPASEVSSTAPERETPSVQYGGASKTDSLFLSLERTPCFGACKAYRIELFRSGFATYDGRNNMEKEGKHTARIGSDTLRVILARAENLGFFSMKDKYDGEVTDLPSTYLRIAAVGKDKKVLGRVGTPQEFKALVSYIEALLLPVPWQPATSKP
ncbi:MAG: hypothetical protein IPI81_11130 [Flavobacteriales bacterium]|nr:hypothetical protein [Flavobacteriales bacterium]